MTERLRGDVEEYMGVLVAAHLGVDRARLDRHTSLADELTVDSLDLAEVVLVLEAEFGIRIPWRRMETMRTYGDLVDVVMTRLHWPKRVGPAASDEGYLARIGLLTPYDVEEITEDALRAGPGATLDLEVDGAIDDARLEATRVRFAWLAARGVSVTVERAPTTG